MFPWMIFPIVPFNNINYNESPPTLYSLLNSIVNFGKEDKTKIVDLAKQARTTVFNFDYPLDSSVDKEHFEEMILNKFLMRRIGQETFTAFQISLNVKLNEVMPKYNKLFASLKDWNILNDGEFTERDLLDDKTTTGTVKTYVNGLNTTESKLDSRMSNLPQNRIIDVENGDYMTDYQLNQGNDTATSKSDATNNTNMNDKIVTKETIKRTETNKIDIFTRFENEVSNIMTLLYKDLDVLFYQIVD